MRRRLTCLLASLVCLVAAGCSTRAVTAGAGMRAPGMSSAAVLDGSHQGDRPTYLVYDP